MDSKFVNQFTRTFEVEKELYRYLHLTSPAMRAALIMIGAVMVIDVAASIVLGMNYANMAVFAMCCILLFVLFFRYYAAMQAAKQRYAEDTNNKGEVNVTATVTDDRLISESSDREEPVEVPLKNVYRVFETPHYYMLHTVDKMVYVFQKGAFTTGDEAAFLPFMQQLTANNKRRRK